MNYRLSNQGAVRSTEMPHYTYYLALTPDIPLVLVEALTTPDCGQ